MRMVTIGLDDTLLDIISVAVMKMRASGSQQNRTPLQYEQWGPGEWRQFRTRSVAMRATLYC
jgi:hypothetical protein